MQRKKDWKKIDQLPITEAHGVHLQLEVQLLFLIKPMKTKKNYYCNTQDNIWKEYRS